MPPRTVVMTGATGRLAPVARVLLERGEALRIVSRNPASPQEQALAALGADVRAIVAPVYFMDNLWNPWNVPLLRAGRFPSPVSAERSLQQVSIADLASFTSILVARLPAFAGERIEVASDELTGAAAAVAASRESGRELAFSDVVADGAITGGPAVQDWSPLD